MGYYCPGNSYFTEGDNLCVILVAYIMIVTVVDVPVTSEKIVRL